MNTGRMNDIIFQFVSYYQTSFLFFLKQKKINVLRSEYFRLIFINRLVINLPTHIFKLIDFKYYFLNLFVKY